ncbi:Serine/threonine kinase [Hibiscus syriacus]|uniref:Receptor-like serine/threonine-protein kinase n=1 Tax=Hibiscus syriacus TaxID=106335 RepID=A0A6A2YP07_HIBSY|nr:Serine/threonine kinase [Hibiscus syriacus]
MASFILLLLFTLMWRPHVTLSITVESFNATGSIRDGDTLVSADRIFELGFFSPGSSTKRYLGIWYMNSNATVPWVANRETPLNDSSGVLHVTNQGILILVDGKSNSVWSSNALVLPLRPVSSPVVQLLDSGNLVVTDGTGNTSSENFIWQSFDYPSDTFIAGMKLGKDFGTGLERYLSSWKNPDDPSLGMYTYQFELSGYPEISVRDSSTILFRSGPYNGVRLSGLLETKENPIYPYDFVFNGQELSLTFNPRNSSTLLRGVLTGDNGSIVPFTWNDPNRGWIPNLSFFVENCDRYALCGANGICDNKKSPACSCLTGFSPNDPREWDAAPGSGGCGRNTPLNCSGDGYVRVSDVKVPETKHSWFNVSMNLQECKDLCSSNCWCTSYTSLDITNGGSGCLLWFTDLIDTRYMTNSGQDVYVKVAASELAPQDRTSHAAKANNRTRIIATVSALSAGVVIAVIIVVLFMRRKKKLKGLPTHHHSDNVSDFQSSKEDLDLPLFDLRAIIAATDDFSFKNMLGEGGFGCVYKGVLKDGQEIAVKRLSSSSKQGNTEFTNEVKHIAKVQHRNLVKLLGCCIEADEKMLIYEYLPNKSLDFFIFDYEMNPKISDFGLARSFGEKETTANTKKVGFSFSGYMSPEYAIDGLYSIKSDVFAFGAWRLFYDGNSMELVADTIKMTCNPSEVLRSVQVSLLCVQRSLEDRPTMSNVVLMLNSEVPLDQPKQPGFFNERDLVNDTSSSDVQRPACSNDFAITAVEAR